MGQEVGDDHALVAAVPRGLDVRTLREGAAGDGPFRSAMIERTAITLLRPFSMRRALRGAIAVISVALWIAGLVEASDVMLAAASMLTVAWALAGPIPGRVKRVIVAPTYVELDGGKRLALDEVRRVHLRASVEVVDFGRPEVHDVIVETRSDQLIAITTPTRAQAEFVAARIEQAYRDFLRVRRP